MITAVLLAHLVGDYILQWNALAILKSKALKGVIAHGAIVWAVTWLMTALFNPAWWPWAPRATSSKCAWWTAWWPACKITVC